MKKTEVENLMAGKYKRVIYQVSYYSTFQQTGKCILTVVRKGILALIYNFPNFIEADHFSPVELAQRSSERIWQQWRERGGGGNMTPPPRLSGEKTLCRENRTGHLLYIAAASTNIPICKTCMFRIVSEA
jgi:hypothetical protein